MDKINKVMERLLQGEQVQWKTLNDVFNLRNGYTPSRANKRYWTDGSIPWFRMEDIRANGSVLEDAIEHVHESGVKGKLFPENSIILATSATVGIHALIKTPHLTNQRFANFSIKDKYKPLLDIKFVYYYFYLICERARQSVNLSSFPSVRMTELRKWEFPIPPLHVQEGIVRILDTFTELIKELTKEQEARQTQYEYYRDKLLTFEEGEVEWVKLGEVTKYEQPNKYIVNSREFCDIPNHTSSIPVLTAGKTFILGYTCESEGIYKAAEKPVIIFDDFTTDTRWIDFDFKIRSSTLKMITSTDETFALQKFIFYWLEIQSSPEKGSNRRQWISNYMNKKIPIPPLHVQEEIVNKLDRFNSLANSITEGLPREIELRQQQYEYYRDLLLSFPKAA